MLPTLLGIETEYSLAGIGVGEGASPTHLCQALLEAARYADVTLPDGGSGIFLPNGARLYIDTGCHPEYATPECVDPWELVAHVGAGDRLMSRLAALLVGRVPGLRQALLLRGNVDYGGNGTSWGCHESYLYAQVTARLHEQILPHLVTRVVYAGAGGFDPLSPGVRFLLSPRARFLSQEASPNTLQERGIICTREDPMCEGYRRLHLVCGESSCSETSTLLKVGTTALVVAMACDGRCPDRTVRLAHPLLALWSIANDPGCRTTVPLALGGQATAVVIQRCYLERAEACCRAGLLPGWAGEICSLWRSTLDALEQDPESTGGTLDWAIKRSLFGAHLRGRLGWAELGVWTSVVEGLRSVLDPWRVEPGVPEELRLQRRSAEPVLKASGLSWDGLMAFLRLRDELLELDLRFGQLGGVGIFDRLDARGALTHRLLPPERLERAGHEPPATTRARPRGELVRQLGTPVAGASGYACDWNRICDPFGRRYVDLSDPFATEIRWRYYMP